MSGISATSHWGQFVFSRQTVAVFLNCVFVYMAVVDMNKPKKSASIDVHPH